MKTTAAVLVEPGSPLVLAELETPALKPGQVLVQVAFSGVCGTQVSEAHGHRGEDRFLPHCLGHEGSGVVREIGEGVTRVKPGDQVILSWIKGDGLDVPGSVYAWDGTNVNAGGITTFARDTVVAENRLTLLPASVSLRDAIMLGCAIPTGVGAVLNVAKPQAGQSIVVFGVGGVGACAIAGAKVAGCDPIIAVDVKPEKLDIARAMGATHTVLSGDVDPEGALGELVPGGVDFAIDCTGRPDVMATCLSSVHAQGGAAVVVGNARFGEQLVIDPRQLNQGKRLLGTWGGDSLPSRDYAYYAELIASGQIDLSPLVSKEYGLDEINEAIADLAAARVMRPVINMEARSSTR